MKQFVFNKELKDQEKEKFFTWLAQSRIEKKAFILSINALNENNPFPAAQFKDTVDSLNALDDLLSDWMDWGLSYRYAHPRLEIKNMIRHGLVEKTGLVESVWIARFESQFIAFTDDFFKKAFKEVTPC